jgi:predicted nucleotidyltransferase
MSKSLINEEIISELKKIKEVEAIYLFGSYAKNKVKPYSDIDLCLITQKVLADKKRALLGSYASDKIDISLFWDLPLSIRFRVFKEGEILYSKDELFLIRVKADTIKEYLDFQPVIERHVKRVFSGA